MLQRSNSCSDIYWTRPDQYFLRWIQFRHYKNKEQEFKHNYKTEKGEENLSLDFNRMSLKNKQNERIPHGGWTCLGFLKNINQ